MKGLKSLKGQLLISSSGLFDPNFRHTVVLIGEHSADGAIGVVLNRPLEVSVAEAVPPLAELVPQGGLLYSGGPVQPASPVLLAEFSDPSVADLHVFSTIGFLTGDVSRDAREDMVRCRIFAGYSGWGPGQLEAEMAQDSWIVEPARIEDVFTEDPDLLWASVLRRKGGEFRMMSRVPFDPTMN